MSGPGIYLFFVGLIMFALGVILLASLPKSDHHWWMYFLVIIGLLLLILGAFLWFSSGAINSLSQGGAFQSGGKGGGAGEAGSLGELEEAAIFV